MRCILCGSTQHKLYKLIKKDKYINDEVKYFKCNRCGLVFIKPQPIKKLKKLYKKEYRPRIGFLDTLKFILPYTRHFKSHLNYLQPLLSLKGDVLDVGSSEGKFLFLLKLRGWNVLGVEATSHYAEFANKVLRVPTINGFIEDVKLDKKFDLVTINDVLEHLNNPIKTLKKVKSLLKPNGKIYVRVPDLKGEAFAAPHLFMYTKDTVTKLLNRISFVIESIDVINNKIHLIAGIKKSDRVKVSAKLPALVLNRT